MIRNEISKIVKSPYMWGVLLFCILINCGILCFENTEDFSSSQYKKVWQQFLSEEKNLQDEIASSKDKAEKYKQNEMTDKEKLYVRFAKELEAVSTYNDYRQRIQENAKKITLFSTFTEGGFAEKNIEKTAAHFKKMKMVKVDAEPSLGIEKMFSTVTGIVVLFFVLYLGYLLFVRENETGIAKLLYVTRFGKRKLFFAKLAAHICGTAVAALIFYGCNFVILRERYGVGDLSRSIQSVLAYRSCGSELSVGQFLILSMIILIFIMTALAIFIDCICILGKRALISIMIFFFCIIGCVLVYVQIPINSNLNWLKYIDPAYCLNAGDIIGKYVNINIWGEPVSYPVVVMAVYFLLLLICMICGMIGFSKMKEESRKSELFNFAFMKNEKRFLKGHDSLFRYELYKVRKGGRVSMILFLFLIVSCFLSYQSHLIFDDEDEYYYYTYMKQLEGEKTIEKTNFIQKENKRFQSLKKKQQKFMEEDKVEDLMILSEDLRPVHGFEKVVERNNYINKYNLHAYVYEGGYVKLMDFSKGNGILMTLGLLLLTFSLCSVFTQDYETGQKMLLQATLLGRKKMAHKKILVSVFIIIISFGIIYLPQFITFYRLYGLVGITEPVGCMGIQSGMEMPIWLWLVFGYVIRLIIMLAYSGFFLFISNKIKSAFVTLTVMSIVIIIIFFVI